jgi:hypothetical protein
MPSYPSVEASTLSSVIYELNQYFVSEFKCPILKSFPVDVAFPYLFSPNTDRSFSAPREAQFLCNVIKTTLIEFNDKEMRYTGCDHRWSFMNSQHDSKKKLQVYSAQKFPMQMWFSTAPRAKGHIDELLIMIN